jgi:Flp pilus assembly secretin CpaC
LELFVKVSRIDESQAVEINGESIPGLNVRQFDTASELTFGQTAVVMGLVEKRTECLSVEGQVKDVAVDVGLMVVVTPELFQPRAEAAASANRDIDSALKR